MSTHAVTDPSVLDGTFMTEAEYLALPEMKTRVELVDGIVVCEPTADYGHQRIIGDLHVRLRSALEAHVPRPAVCLSPLDVRFAPGRILQPDLFVYLEPLAEPVTMPLTRIPDVCIEVVSRRHAYDRVVKRQLYADAGVAELWTVVRKIAAVERWTGRGLAEREECKQRLATPLLPGFELDVETLLRG